jgi:hypothetical protein
MRMKNLTPLVLVAMLGAIQPALAQNMVNPLSLLAPSQNTPFSSGLGGLSSPFGLGALNPLNPINSINPLSPWNSYGGLSNPALGLGALGALGALSPNMLAGGSPFGGSPFGGSPYQANAFPGNPFAGNPFAGNPFVRQQQYGAPAFSPSMPSYPNMPFGMQQPQSMAPGGYYPMQQQMAYPYMPYAAQQQPQQPSLANLFGMQNQPPQQQQQQQMIFPGYFGAQQPVQQQPTPQQPGLANFFGINQLPGQAPAQPVQQPAQPAFPFNPFQSLQALQPTKPPVAQPPAPMLDASKPTPLSSQQPAALPFFFFAPQQAAPVSPAPAAAKPVAPEAKADDADTLPPLDPAAFMQMYMQPGK